MSDWLEHLDERGFAITGPLLSAAEAAELAGAFDDDQRYRSRVQMGRYRFGEGDYAYFAYPLPPAVERLRRELYPPLADVANEWGRRRQADGWEPWPADLDGMLERCHAAGQDRPTPLVLRYGPGGYNTLHQDLYGDLAFPLQAVTALNRAGTDFAGGQFVLVEQRPRAQSRAHVIELERGAFAIFPTRTRPVEGSRGHYRTTMRHGVATVHAGERITLGIIFHDAA